MATAFKQKNFRIPLELAEKLEEKAKQTGLTETEIVIKALQEYLVDTLLPLAVNRKEVSV